MDVFFFHLEEWEKKTTNMGIEHDWTEDCKNTAAILTIRTQWNCPHAELKLQSYEILYMFILNNNRKTYNYNFNLQPKKKDTWIYIYIVNSAGVLGKKDQLCKIGT